MTMRTIILSLLTCVALAGASDDYERKLAETDTTDPDQLYVLAMWCKDQGLNYKYSRHLKQAIKLDPDHQASRNALGYVWYDEKWTHRSRVPGGLQTEEEQREEQRGGGARVRGPAPDADDIDWDLTIPENPTPENAKWLAKFTATMNRVDNYSGDMDAAWRTLILPEYIQSAVSAMATALMDEGHKDLYGPVMMAQELIKSGEPDKIAMAKALVPFMVHASNRVTNDEELYFFAMFVGSLGDKRVVPRLIEILKQGGEAADGAKAGLAHITLIPEDEVTVEKAEQWWRANHASSDAEVFGKQLESRDPMVRIEACRKLYPEQDPRIVPTLIEVLKEHPRGPAKHGAVDLLKQITGNDWDLTGDQPPDKLKLRIERLEQWWEENGRTFIFLEFREQMNTGGGPAVVRKDPTQVWINALSSLDRDEARTAYDGLLGKGMDAVPALIKTLSSNNGIRRGKARDLLRAITKQNFGFEAVQGSDQARKDAIAKWEAWYAEHGEEDEPDE